MALAVDLEALELQLIRHEGVRLHPYTDGQGVQTIGIGRNLDDRGITREEALFLLRNDMRRCVAEVERAFPWAAALTPPRQGVLVNMCFNLGVTRLKTFRRFLAAAKRGDHETAATEMLASTWASQVGQRALELAALWREGDAP